MTQVPPDYHYFGPQAPGGARSPYWPAGVPWNPRAAADAMGVLLSELRSAVDNGPFGALPADLRCACTGPTCLLPVLDRYCAAHGIRRAQIPTSLPADSERWTLLVPRVIDGPRGPALSAEAGATAVRATLYHADAVRDPDAKLRRLWGVVDLDALADAVSTEGSQLWKTMVASVAAAAP